LILKKQIQYQQAIVDEHSSTSSSGSSSKTLEGEGGNEIVMVEEVEDDPFRVTKKGKSKIFVR